MRKIFTLSILVTIAVLVPHLLKSEGNVEPEGTNVTSKSTPASMVLIPAGKFWMGSEKLMNVVGGERVSDKTTQPIHAVYLDAFYIDTHEVTFADYKKFLIETGHGSELPTNIDELCPTDQHPIVGVTWQDAMAYAKWAGKRLPTEAEWEKAARGGLIDETYPWGNEEPNSSLTNLGKETRPVGSYTPNSYGLYDMAGNASEWCLDLWDKDFYANSPKENPFPGRMSIAETVKNYKNIRDKRVVRGVTGVPFVAARSWEESTQRYTNVGFRCAMDAR